MGFFIPKQHVRPKGLVPGGQAAGSFDGSEHTVGHEYSIGKTRHLHRPDYNRCVLISWFYYAFDELFVPLQTVSARLSKKKQQLLLRVKVPPKQVQLGPGL